MATRAPSRANASAIEWPSPAPPPVTIATLPANSIVSGRHAIDWNRFASALIRFAVSMSRSVIFIPASWVQNENETML